MPSVKMRRSTRVFVPKTKDGEGVRVLRSGRRLRVESGAAKIKASVQESTKCLEEDKSHKEDSLWGDSDDETSGISELDREWKNRREQFYTHGYREGISAGQVDSAQEGFNRGFKDSVLAGYNWGLVRGVTSALAYLPEELRKKLVQTDDNATEFKSLHVSARSISTVAAQKLFYDNKNRKNLEPKIQQSGDQISDSNNVLEDHFNKLQLLLQQSTELTN